MQTMKRWLFKFFGALFMERKEGELALSFHRTLGLVMFVWCLVQWTQAHVVDDAAVYTLWGLIGLKAVSKIAEGRA